MSVGFDPAEVDHEDLPKLLGNVYGRYAKEVILDRALPDARDGLKPSQRRIIYGMAEAGHTPERPYVKSARVVGDVMGHYHPHGDSSIYGALVRMSEWWVAPPLVDLSGNGGSLDDDPPAAMRYTEVRLSPLALRLTQDLDKQAVPMVSNFDESTTEPEVLPAYFPALLVMGASGVAVGFASEIPPHNLNEAIDAAIGLAKDPNLTDDELFHLIPGPDFPTGGMIAGADGLRSIFHTGSGKIILRGRASVEPAKNRTLLVITEIPYRVVKSQLVADIDRIRAAKTVEGLLAVRDESDHEAAVRIVVELRTGTDADKVLQYLYQHTQLERSYSANMTAIVNGRPRQVGVRGLLKAYIGHLYSVIRRRTAYDLAKAKERLHILEGLIRAVADLDEIIRTIRQSRNRKDAQERLVAGWSFTEAQADAILTLQLYRLTGLEIETLRKEMGVLEKKAKAWQRILDDDAELTKVATEELAAVKAKFSTPRRTTITDHVPGRHARISAIRAVTAAEDVVVAVSLNGDVKRVPTRSYQRGEAEGVRENDHIGWILPATTKHRIAYVFEDGHLFTTEVRSLPDRKWRDPGLPLVNFVSSQEHGELRYAGVVPSQADGDASKGVCYVLADGNARRLSLDLAIFPHRQAGAPSLPAGAGRLMQVFELHDADRMFFLTAQGQSILVAAETIPSQGRVARGVRVIRLKGNDSLAAGCAVPTDAAYVVLIGQRGTIAKMPMADFPLQGRSGGGTATWPLTKRSPERTAFVSAVSAGTSIRVLLEASEETLDTTALTKVARGRTGRNHLATLAPGNNIRTITVG